MSCPPNFLLSIYDLFILYIVQSLAIPLTLSFSHFQIVKYFMDPKTFQKVKFVYPKNKDSVELMKSYFDVDNLPTEFGGTATLNYDHEEFSRQMAQDDVKVAKFWGFDKHPPGANGYSAVEVAPEPEAVALPATASA